MIPYLERSIRNHRMSLKTRIKSLSRQHHQLDAQWRVRSRKLEAKLERANERRMRKENAAATAASSVSPLVANESLPGGLAGPVRRGGFISDAVRSEAELESVLAMLMSHEVPVEKCAAPVEMCLDRKWTMTLIGSEGTSGVNVEES
jgi:hypothetical protein